MAHKNNITEYVRTQPERTRLFTIGQIWVDGRPGEEVRIAWETEPTIEDIVNLRHYLGVALEKRGIKFGRPS